MIESIPSKDALMNAAQQAREQAIAPYSGYKVGAALLTESGEIITAGNVESSTYGLTLCAERVAIFSALSQDHRNFTAIAVATDNGASPCGACRQILWEFAGDITVYLVDNEEIFKVHTMGDLFPRPFDAHNLPGGDSNV